MDPSTAAILAAGHDLAERHRLATIELGAHWPDEIGVCLGCGEPYPCGEEWLTMRAISGIEARWRRESVRLAEARAAG